MRKDTERHEWLAGASLIDGAVLRLDQEVSRLEVEDVSPVAKEARPGEEDPRLEAENADRPRHLTRGKDSSHEPPNSEGYGKELRRRPAMPKGVPRRSGGQAGRQRCALRRVLHAGQAQVRHGVVCRRAFRERSPSASAEAPSVRSVSPEAGHGRTWRGRRCLLRKGSAQEVNLCRPEAPSDRRGSRAIRWERAYLPRLLFSMTAGR